MIDDEVYHCSDVSVGTFTPFEAPEEHRPDVL